MDEFVWLVWSQPDAHPGRENRRLCGVTRTAALAIAYAEQIQATREQYEPAVEVERLVVLDAVPIEELAILDLVCR